MKKRPLQSRRGFTLTELLVASGLAGVVLSAFVGGFLQYRRLFHQKNLEQELQQNVRTAMMFLQRDLRYAGSGMVMGFQNLSDWFALPVQVNQIPWIESSGNGRDRLTLVGISGAPVAELTEMLWEGETVFTFEIRDPSILPYVPQAGDVLLLAGIEAVMVNEVLADDRVRVSRDPLTPGIGVHLIYPVGTEIFQLNKLRYWIAVVNGVPSLLREDSRYIYETDADRVIADGIERFEVQQQGNRVSLLLSGRSRRVSLTGSREGDGLLRFELTSENRLRNLQPRLSIQGWPSDLLLGFSPFDGGEEGGDGQNGTPPPEYSGPPGQNPNRQTGGGRNR